jgi:hypothetical protein
MATELPVNGAIEERNTSFAVKAGLARMLQGGVIMDVVNAEQVPTTSFPPTSHWRADGDRVLGSYCGRGRRLGRYGS